MGFFKKLFTKKEDEWEWKKYDGPNNYRKYRHKKTGEVIYKPIDEGSPMFINN